MIALLWFDHCLVLLRCILSLYCQGTVSVESVSVKSGGSGVQSSHRTVDILLNSKFGSQCKSRSPVCSLYLVYLVSWWTASVMNKVLCV